MNSEESYNNEYTSEEVFNKVQELLKDLMHESIDCCNNPMDTMAFWIHLSHLAMEQLDTYMHGHKSYVPTEKSIEQLINVILPKRFLEDK